MIELIKMSTLKIKNLNHKIKDNNILQNIHLETKDDKITCILGPSGSGKTTLLKLIAGLESAQEGEIYINDKLVSSSSIHVNTEKRNIGFLFQDFALFPHLTIKENLKFAINSKNANLEINEILKLIKLTNSLQKYPHELSGGEQQRVALARSIISKPQLLLLDEPFSNLDLNLKEEIRDDTLHLLQKFNTSVIIVTHDPFEAMFISNKIYILKKDGSIIQSGTPNDLYNKPKTSYVAEFFGETNKFSGIVENSIVDTAVGQIPISKHLESKNVDIHIRPQAIKLSQEKTPVNGVKGIVMASKLMGSYSFIHLSVLDKNNNIIHVHSHMPPNFNPKQSTAVGIEIDVKEIFVFDKN
ncbi:MAG: Fe(3+) ions import ATP-binding protein FbpC [Alphaproteobacteria bacterium MarineAlpha5_Bin9]|nr:MAG: Fe(3+) ions import ATP-binding protein FbpC [Alphaproteobacteria bacterium MarineAlpha5_Bin9]